MSIEETISATEANRRFSHLLRRLREGHSYVVTSHGTPVARLVPAERDERTAEGARVALIERLRQQPAVTAGRWSRDELYDDEPAEGGA